MPLGDELGADDDVGLAVGDGLKLQPQPLDPAGKVGGEHDHPRLGQARRHLLGDALDAGAAGDEMIERTTGRAGFRPGLAIAAMVADELAAKAMLDQPARAVRALEAVAAGAAQRQRRIAAPVEEQQRLLAPGDRLLHLPQQDGGQKTAARRRVAAHVDGVKVGQGGLGIAGRQHDAAVAALHSIDAGLDRGRRRGQHHGEAADAAAHHRHVAGVVEDAVLLLVGGVVLLVDDDQAEVAKRQEQRRARARHHLDPPFRHLPPHPLAHPWRQVGVPFGRLCPEAVVETLEEGGGERDLRHQHQHLASRLKCCRHRFEIDLRLARAGDAVDERDRKAGAGLLAQRLRRRLLVGRQEGPGMEGVGQDGDRRRRDRHGLEQPLREKPVDHRRRHAGGMRQPRARPGHAVAGKFQHLPARLGDAVGRAAAKAQALKHRLGVEGGRRAQDHARHHARRRQRPAGHPVDEAARVLPERRAVEHLRNGPELPRVDRVGLAVPDDAGDLARPQRHAHDRTRPDIHAGGHRIGIGALRRCGHQHRRDARLGRIFAHRT